MGSLCFVGGASAGRIVVRPGESIQAAIDRASPGDTILVRPGTYREYLTIEKDDLTLKAADGPGSVLLVPPDTPAPPGPCELVGICVVGEVDEYGNPNGPPVRGTRVRGFTLAHFGYAIFLGNADDSTVAETEVYDNGPGILARFVSGVRFLHDVAHDNQGAGFAIVDSPNANATVLGNESYRNVTVCSQIACTEAAGFFFSDASHGVVRDNRAWGNCAGYMFGGLFDRAFVGDWKVTGNLARRNNLLCPIITIDPRTFVEGTGFLLLGTHDVVVSGNVARGNTGRVELSGGIVLERSDAAEPVDNVIRDNVALRNDPFDIRWDETGSGNVFRNNSCRTSQPDWICANSSG